MDPFHGCGQSEGPFAAVSVNANPQFQPIKLGLSGAPGKNLKPPKAPEKPLMPYMRYSRKIWDSVKAANQESKLWEIGRIIGQMWRELSNAEKQKFIDEYEAEKADYAEALRNYHNSPIYQQYLAAKENAALLQQQQQAMEEKEAKQRSGGSGTPQSQNQKLEAKLGLPPLEPSDYEEMEQVSVRQLANVRFARNQRLLLEIFNESCVPDNRSLVTNQRMLMLKRQVHSLTMHQTKLEAELEQLEEKFQSKRRCLEQSGQDFSKRMGELSASPLETQNYDDMVKKAMAQLLAEYGASREPAVDDTSTATDAAPLEDQL